MNFLYYLKDFILMVLNLLNGDNMSEYDDYIESIKEEVKEAENTKEKIDIINSYISEIDNPSEIVNSDNFPETVWEDLENKSDFQFRCMLVSATSREILFK